LQFCVTTDVYLVLKIWSQVGSLASLVEFPRPNKIDRFVHNDGDKRPSSWLYLYDIVIISLVKKAHPDSTKVLKLNLSSFTEKMCSFVILNIWHELYLCHKFKYNRIFQFYQFLPTLAMVHKFEVPQSLSNVKNTPIAHMLKCWEVGEKGGGRERVHQTMAIFEKEIIPYLSLPLSSLSLSPLSPSLPPSLSLSLSLSFLHIVSSLLPPTPLNVAQRKIE